MIEEILCKTCNNWIAPNHSYLEDGDELRCNVCNSHWAVTFTERSRTTDAPEQSTLLPVLPLWILHILATIVNDNNYLSAGEKVIVALDQFEWDAVQEYLHKLNRAKS